MVGFNAGDKIPELLKGKMVKPTKPLTTLGIVEADINGVKVYLPFSLFNVDPNDSAAVGSVMNPEGVLFKQGWRAEDVFANCVATHFTVRLAKKGGPDWDKLKVLDSDVPLSDLKTNECKIIKKGAFSSSFRKLYKRQRSSNNRILAHVFMEHPSGLWLSLPVDCFD